MSDCESMWVYVREHVSACERVSMCGCVCACMVVCLCVRLSMRAGLDGWLLAGRISWKIEMGMGFKLKDATVAVVANLGFETSYYG